MAIEWKHYREWVQCKACGYGVGTKHGMTDMKECPTCKRIAELEERVRVLRGAAHFAIEKLALANDHFGFRSGGVALANARNTLLAAMEETSDE